MTQRAEIFMKSGATILKWIMPWRSLISRISASEAAFLSREEIWVFEDSHLALETARKAGFQTFGIYDRNNPWQKEIKAVSHRYLGPGESFLDLI